MQGLLSLLLHAHLPYVRHPEQAHSLEERWLFEAMSECYLPLLAVFRKLAAEGVKYRISLSISPTLLGMWHDPLLQQRYLEHLRQLEKLAKAEMRRNKGTPRHALAQYWLNLYQSSRENFAACNNNPATAFGQLAADGYVELITCAATHAYLPLLRDSEDALRIQLQLAAETHRQVFGSSAKGIWLPECGYYPGLEEYVAAAGFTWFTLDSHGVLHADNAPRYGIFSPLQCRNGVIAYGRNPAAAESVWDANSGYPGDADYLDFHRDLGYEAPEKDLPPYFRDPQNRIPCGIKYHRVTGATTEKQDYDPQRAAQKAKHHAQDFLARQSRQLQEQAAYMDYPPLSCAPYDAELFGHWWHEGPQWLEHVLRGAASAKYALQTVTPSDYAARQYPLQTATPSISSWGEQGYHSFWLNQETAWVYPYLDDSTRRLRQWTEKNRNTDNLLHRRTLNMMLKYLLLAQASDWSFLLKAGTAADYARQRLEQYLSRFYYLEHGLQENRIDETALTGLEALDNLFPHLDFNHF